MALESMCSNDALKFSRVHREQDWTQFDDIYIDIFIVSHTHVVLCNIELELGLVMSFDILQ